MGNGAIRAIGDGPFGGGGLPFPAGYDTGVSVLAIVLRFTIWVLFILAAVWLVHEVLRTIRDSRAGAGRHVSPALAELDLLYARGEVNRVDYITRRADIAGVPQPVNPPG